MNCFFCACGHAPECSSSFPSSNTPILFPWADCFLCPHSDCTWAYRHTSPPFPCLFFQTAPACWSHVHTAYSSRRLCNDRNTSFPPYAHSDSHTSLYSYPPWAVFWTWSAYGTSQTSQFCPSHRSCGPCGAGAASWSYATVSGICYSSAKRAYLYFYCCGNDQNTIIKYAYYFWISTQITTTWRL